VKYVLPNFHKIKCSWCQHEAFAEGTSSVPQNSIWVTKKGIVTNPTIVAQGKKVKIITRKNRHKFSP